MVKLTFKKKRNYLIEIYTDAKQMQHCNLLLQFISFIHKLIFANFYCKIGEG